MDEDFEHGGIAMVSAITGMPMRSWVKIPQAHQRKAVSRRQATYTILNAWVMYDLSALMQVGVVSRRFSYLVQRDRHVHVPRGLHLFVKLDDDPIIDVHGTPRYR